MHSKWIGYFLFLLLFCVSLEGAEIHALLIGDTAAEEIEVGVYEDVKNISSLLRKAALFSDLGYQEYVLIHKDTTRENVWSIIEEMKVGPDDVLVFYFSGHGYRTSIEKDSKWPNLHFTESNEGVCLDEIAKRLCQKNGRLTITLADCCNNEIPLCFAPTLFYKKRAFHHPYYVSKHYKDLFREPRGEIISVASEPGGYAMGSNMGGVYTLALINKIESFAIRDQAITWDEVFQNVGKQVTDQVFPFDEKQIPIYEVNIH